MWNTINSGYPARVIYDLRHKPIGWVALFIHGTQPTHEEIAQKLLEIYERTGRIVVDAFITSNFVKTANGNIVCIDVGAAFFLESRPGLAQNHSQVSLDTWNGNAEYTPMSGIYRKVFAKHSRIIVDVEKALLYLQMHRPDFRSVSAMLRQGSLINLLALSYDENSTRQNQTLANLDAYIASCVHANDDGFCVVVPSLTINDADAQDQDEQPAVVSENILQGYVIQSNSGVPQVLPTVQSEFPSYPLRSLLFSPSAVVVDQKKSVSPPPGFNNL